tara:strand:- start:263 stop:1243 length:981 start_codon:yes stop_codon:yes gene_type:complete
MGGRRPASPQIVPSQPPVGMIGGGPSIFGSLIRSAGRGKKRFKSGRRRRGGEPQRPPTMNFPRTITGRGGREAPIGYSIGRADNLIAYPNDPRLKGKKLDYSQSPYKNIRRQYEQRQVSQPKKDIGVGGGPGIPPRFAIGTPKRPEGGDRPSIMPIPPRRPGKPVQRPIFPFPKDDLGPAPEREIPLPKERLPKITRESDPRGSAPFAPDERAMAKERFFERMFERADSKRQQKSMQQEERGRIKQSRRDERRMRMSEPGEININAERRRRRGGRKRRNLEAFDMLSQEDKNLMTQNTRGRLRRRGRSREDRAMFRNRFAERLRRR